MSLPTTHVSFPAGAVTGASPILAVHTLPDGRTAVVTGATPFHPVDHTWPDQPADLGTLTVDGTAHPVVDCLTGALGPDGAFAAGGDIPARRGDEEWSWLVLHVLPAGALGAEAVGRTAELAVDAERRGLLSAAHTGCHLLALALNAALAPRWRKDPGRADAFGHPDFDSLAMDSSVMDTTASTDTYRIGKSLKKKGFTVDATEELPALADALPALTAEVNARLAAWVAADAAVRIEVPGPELTARRRWHAELPDGPADIACGGTHLHHLGELTGLRTELTLSADGAELVARTSPERA
ncbi:metal-dependent hydrolase [Streptomyces sp. TLI_171]|uniref:metal-dependent hydrolase n=1 Tax=Streptomyces sp. TLI_171 TaxID=1938859 RepID=UPI000C1767D3|nr:metal-dependent hydrolase [Streptomyces sp. TLI_171]RKE20187.1 alanyl-tRNA synthetase [Streptomyces sp. TLI_171]